MKEKKLVIVLAALLLVVLATIAYLLSSGKLNSKLPYETSIKNLETQSDSSEPETIEADLTTTDLGDLDKELTDIEKELNSE